MIKIRTTNCLSADVEIDKFCKRHNILYTKEVGLLGMYKTFNLYNDNSDVTAIYVNRVFMFQKKWFKKAKDI